MNTFGFHSVQFSPRRGWVSFLLLFVGFSIFIMIWWQELWKANTVKNLFLVDNSLSMMVQDIEMRENRGFFSRLDIAKKLGEDFTNATNSEIAIATFSRDATLEMPFSSDKILTNNVFSGITARIYGGGSNIFDAIETIQKIYGNTTRMNIIVLTDAEFFEKPNQNIVIPQNTSISIVGIGTEKGGFMLQGYNNEGKPIYRKYKGEVAVSKFDKTALKQLGEEFSAKIFHLDKEEKLSTIISELENNKRTENIFFWYEFLGFLCLLGGIFINPYQPK